MEKTNKYLKNPLFIGGAAVILIGIIIAIIVICINIAGRPNEEKATQVVNEYILAMTEGNGEKMLATIDTEAYVIFDEKGTRDFDETYNNKSEFISEYLQINELADSYELTQKVKSDFENVYGYYEYTVKEITGIQNVSSSDNLILVKAKVQLKSNRYSSENNAKFYILKNNGDYKIVGMDM